MERLSLVIHLGVLTGTLIFSTAALSTLFLRCSRIDSRLQLFSQPQTWTTISKCTCDVTLVVLLTLEVSATCDGQQRTTLHDLCLGDVRSDLAVKFFTRVSLTCVIAAEVC